MFRPSNPLMRILIVLAFCGLQVPGFSRLVSAQEEPPANVHPVYVPLVYVERAPGLSAVVPGPGPSAIRGASSTHVDRWPGGRSYVVQPGDTLLTVALEMGLDLEQVSCLLSPSFRWEQPLVIGDVLVVPSTSFACHRVALGDTVHSLSEQYGANGEDIRAEAWNEIVGDPVPDRFVRIPLQVGDSLPSQMSERANVTGVHADLLPTDWPYGSGRFLWPVRGWLSQGFQVGHSAIDIAANAGTPVKAADRGVVIRAGWSTLGYGQFVVVDHNIDYLTLYAHLSEIFVTEGDVVAQGQSIGLVGSTGNSTGPHLHFEIRDFGQRVDPLLLLNP